MGRNRFLIVGICLLVLCIFGFPNPCHALVQVAVGYGPTKQSAIDDARRNAVQQGLGAYIKSETKIVDAAVDYNRIIAKSSGYIRSYDILEESKDPSDSTHKVKLSVILEDSKMEKLLQEFKKDSRFQKAFQEIFCQRRIVVLYSKRNSSSLPLDNPSITSLLRLIEDGLKKYGFRVFLPEHIKRIKTASVADSLDQDTAIRIAQQENGDAVVLADVQTPTQRRRSPDGFYVVKAQVALKAFDFTTGELFANATPKKWSKNKSKYYNDGLENAIKESGQKAVDTLVEKIVGRYDVNTERHVEIIFRDVPQIEQDRISRLFNGMGWDYKIVSQSGSFIHFEIPGECDPARLSTVLNPVLKKADMMDLKKEIMGARITYYRNIVLY